MCNRAAMVMFLLTEPPVPEEDAETSRLRCLFKDLIREAQAQQDYGISRDVDSSANEERTMDFELTTSTTMGFDGDSSHATDRSALGSEFEHAIQHHLRYVS